MTYQKLLLNHNLHNLLNKIFRFPRKLEILNTRDLFAEILHKEVIVLMETNVNSLMDYNNFNVIKLLIIAIKLSLVILFRKRVFVFMGLDAILFMKIQTKIKRKWKK